MEEKPTIETIISAIMNGETMVLFVTYEEEVFVKREDGSNLCRLGTTSELESELKRQIEINHLGHEEYVKLRSRISTLTVRLSPYSSQDTSARNRKFQKSWRGKPKIGGGPKSRTEKGPNEPWLIDA